MRSHPPRRRRRLCFVKSLDIDSDLVFGEQSPQSILTSQFHLTDILKFPESNLAITKFGAKLTTDSAVNWTLIPKRSLDVLKNSPDSEEMQVVRWSVAPTGHTRGH